tara:strand:+ start:2024 stop:2635 length:612 start_codon:yes stop_codon:yes gene_type:complete
LIVCEGAKTERLYLEAVVAHLRLTSADVVVAADCPSAPRHVVEHAKKLVVQEGPPSQGGYDFVYCVFDRDTHHSYNSARDQIIALNKSRKFFAKSIEAIYSIPCFEYWFLLHFVYKRSPLVDSNGNSCGEVAVRELMKINTFENYRKSICPAHIAALIENIDRAKSNSIRASRDAVRTGEANPSTNMHILITKLESIAPPKKP